MILAFDTTLGSCSVALTKGSNVLYSKVEKIGRGHAEAIFYLVEEVLLKSKKNLGDLEALVLTVGPGSFTGVRVAVSLAKGLALSLNIPIRTITSLEALMLEPLSQNLIKNGDKIASFIDARRGQAYAQKFIYLDKNIIPQAQSEPEVIPQDTISSWSYWEPDIIVSSPTLNIKDRALWKTTKIFELEPDAGLIGLTIKSKSFEIKRVDLKPLYIRAPDAIKMKPMLGLGL